MRKINEYFYLLSALVFILIAALVPGSYYPSFLTHTSALNHIFSFIMLGFIFQKVTRLKVLWVVTSLLLFGWIIELLQLAEGFRQFSIRDILFDVFGIGIFLALLYIYTFFKDRNFLFLKK